MLNDLTQLQTSNLEYPTSNIEQNKNSDLKIDIHTHIMPEKMPNWTEKFGYGEFIHLEHRDCDACMMKGDKVFRVVGQNAFKEDVRRKEMEDTDVTVQVLSTIPVLFNYWAKALDGYQPPNSSTIILPKQWPKNPVILLVWEPFRYRT
jgi:hypothetical protein